MLAFRETAIDAPAYAAAGSATLSVAGTLYIRHQDGLVVAGEPGAALPGNAIAGSPYGQAVFAAGVLRSPAATFSDASRVSIGTLDLRDTSTQLTFDNTQPYNAATGQGVQLGQLLFGGGNALTIAGNGGFGFQGGITVLGPNAAYQGPALSANGGQLSFLLPADAVNGTTMLRASAPITTQGATVAMQAAGPLKRLLPGDRIMLISATTGTVANPLPHPGVWRVPLPVRCAERVRADRHVGLHQSDAGRQQTLPPLYRRRHRRAGRQRRHAVGRRPARPRAARPVLQSGPGPHPLHRQEPQAGPRQRRVRLRPGRRHRRWRLRGGAAGRGRAHPLSRPGFVGRPVGRGQGPRRQRRRGHPGALLVPGRHVCRGLAAQRTHARQLYRRHRRQHQLPQSFELLGPTPCWAM